MITEKKVVKKIEKKKVSPSQAYRDGYMAAIVRKKETDNPYEEKEMSNQWLAGHEQGTKIVTFHTANISTRYGTTWFGLGGRK